MKKSIIATNLDQVLSSTGPYTLFAPSDVAFSKLKEGEVDDLLNENNTVKLTTFLNHHVVEGKLDTKNLTDGQSLTTLYGNVLKVSVLNGTVTVGGVELQKQELRASNGVIHPVDQVLVN